MEAEQATPGRRVLKRYSAEDRGRLIKEFQASGQNRREFCEQHGVNLTTFHGWFKKQRRATRSKKFVEVNVSAQRGAPIEVQLANGTSVGIRPHGTQEDLIALIRGIAGC